MSSTSARKVSIAVDAEATVSGLLNLPTGAKACFIVGHGAGAGMQHSFMESVAVELAERKVATLRYNFPYMEHGSKRPDPPKLCHATVRAAVDTAGRLAPSLPLFAGGKSFGGRMTSQTQAESPLPSVRGLVFIGFPLHPAKKPSDTRAKHLYDVKIPMLFLQGTRDELADLTLLKPIVQRLGKQATLKVVEAADHSFHVLVRSGRTDAQVRSELFDTIAGWIDVVEGAASG
jgi:uncharacterized protein